MQTSRRKLLQVALGGAVVSALPVFSRPARATVSQDIGDGLLTVVSDGHLVLPIDFQRPSNMSAEEFTHFKQETGMSEASYEPSCNIAVWQSNDKTVLFDVGAGETFMPSTGRLLSNLEAAGVYPEDVTDVIISHAHPDHLWGLVDDFDELVFTDANYHMHQSEWDFWSDDATLDKMPESRKVFAVGAKNRFAYLEDRVQLFRNGAELVSGIEVIETPGHTPGHTSFGIHNGSESAVIVGDALTHPVFSFEPRRWLSSSDQDPDQARATRRALLDRLTHEKALLAAYHLAYPGLGTVEAKGNAFQFVPEA